ncbi:hypothetical protein BE15_26865 [Sorangium cellulosum]|uniref:Uncharacterized protein n=1 Tax=Sorangium cellulosum TaxID=56 RepID=A0A150QIC9_SORCE|nr:hypothetical protein BE15_26865 [Sorangium cellulosum]
MHVEIAAHERVGLMMLRFDVRQPSDTRELLEQHPMQSRIDPVCVDHDRHQPAYRRLDRLVNHVGQRHAHHIHHLLHVAVDDGGHQRLLAGEVLVERADADARRERDLVRAGRVVPLLRQNASGRREQRVDGQLRPLLGGEFPRRGLLVMCGASGMRADRI